MQRARGALLPSTQTLSAKRGRGAEAACAPARSAGAEGEEGRRGEGACPPRSNPLSLGLVNQLRSVAAHCVRVVFLSHVWTRGRSVEGVDMRRLAIGFVSKKPSSHGHRFISWGAGWVQRACKTNHATAYRLLNERCRGAVKRRDHSCAGADHRKTFPFRARAPVRDGTWILDIPCVPGICGHLDFPMLVSFVRLN